MASDSPPDLEEPPGDGPPGDGPPGRPLHAPLLRATLDATPDGVLLVNREGQTLLVNQQFVRMWRIPDGLAAQPQDLRLELIKGQLVDPDQFTRRVTEFRNAPHAEGHDELRFRDGRIFERITGPVVLDGEAVGRVWVFRDVTEARADASERARLEERLRLVQKMEALGALAGVVAHDFNNLLSVVGACADLIVKQLPVGAPGREEADDIVLASARAAQLARRLLAVGRRQTLHPQPTSLDDVLRGLRTMLARLIGDRIDLRLRLGPALGVVHVDRSSIEDAVVNLAANARDAISGRGTVTIETSDVSLDPVEATRSVAVPGDYVLLAVTDTGVGMDETVQRHVFEPFYTTKPEGTGLGLSSVYGTIAQSGGFVRVSSRVGQGSRFEIYLPRVSAGADRVSVESVSVGHEGSGGGASE